MVVIRISKCPPKLRGDLTKWLIQIDTGVYVGNLNARVRENLWERICSMIEFGTATMVFNTNNEQRLNFYSYASDYRPVDYDGLILVKHKK